MTSRKHQFAEGEFYHIYTHSVGDMTIFKNDRDFKRFLVTLFAANSDQEIPRLDRASDLNLVWDIRDGKIKKGQPLVDIISFCLMPTHFHLLLKERGNSHITNFMHRVSISFAKYFNIKYNRRGHVFESKFHSKFIEDNEYLLHVSAYIHLNPKDLPGFSLRERYYEWSTYQDYTDQNRWGKLLTREPISLQFQNSGEYLDFIDGARKNKDSDFTIFNHA